MKFRVVMKHPDTLHDAIEDAVKDDLEGIADKEEREAVAKIRAGKASVVAARWFEYGEYLTVEIDTDAETCVVVPFK